MVYIWSTLNYNFLNTPYISIGFEILGNERSKAEDQMMSATKILHESSKTIIFEQIRHPHRHRRRRHAVVVITSLLFRRLRGHIVVIDVFVVVVPSSSRHTTRRVVVTSSTSPVYFERRRGL